MRSANHAKFTEECVACNEKHFFSKKNVYKWTKFVKERRNSIKAENRLVRLTMPDPVNALISVDRRIILNDFSEQL